MAAPLISIIVPCFNVERYIEQCISSLLHAGCGSIEVICVDDMSTDGTVSKIKDVMSRDYRIRLIRNESGAKMYGGGCRNIGIEVASGDFVYFCDSDDYVLRGLFQECLAACSDLNADVCCFRHIRVDAETGMKDYSRRGLRLDLIKDRNAKSYDHTGAENVFISSGTESWDKFYSMSFLKSSNARFQSIKNNDDNSFHVKTMALAKRIVPIDKVLYVYRTKVPTSVQLDFARGGRQQDFISAMIEASSFIDSLASKELERQFDGWILEKLKYVTRHCEILSVAFVDEIEKFVHARRFYRGEMLDIVRNMRESMHKEIT